MASYLRETKKLFHLLENCERRSNDVQQQQLIKTRILKAKSCSKANLNGLTIRSVIHKTKYFRMYFFKDKNFLIRCSIQNRSQWLASTQQAAAAAAISSYRSRSSRRRVNHIVQVSLIERVQIMPNQTDVSKGCEVHTRSPALSCAAQSYIFQALLYTIKTKYLNS